MSQEFITPDDSNILKWIHEGTRNSGFAGLRGISIPTVAQPLVIGVRGNGSQQQATYGICQRKKNAPERS